jgi:D-threo-aldose 1-dehydrogenase
VRRSIEDSLQRLGVNSLDVAFVHDISPDFAYFPNGWEEQYDIARKGAFPALSKMRDEGIIRAWGIGVNTPQPMLKVMDDADPDVCLCARQYSLIDHADAVNDLFPAVRKKNISLVIGSSLNAGFISGSPRYNYGKEKLQNPRGRDRKARKTPEGGRSLWRGSPYGCASILGSAGCRGRPRRRGAKPSADRRGLQFAAGENPVRILGRA